MQRAPGTTMRLVTYNIHKGVGGVDRRYDLGRTAEVLASCDADLVLLQEVASGLPRAGGEGQLDRLGERLGYPHRTFAPNVRRKVGVYGNAVLSRHPIHKSVNLDLTVPPKKPRGALHVRIDVDGHALRVFVLHLGLSGLERRVQIRYLLDWLAHQHVPLDEPIVVAGDMNDVFDRIGRVFLGPAGFVEAGTSAPTFPAMRPLRCLDRVFVRGLARPLGSGVPLDALARRASDHLPVVCDLRVGPDT